MLFVSAPAAKAGSRLLVEVGSSAVPIKTTLHLVLVAFAFTLPVLIFVTVGGGFLLVQRALQPIDQVIRSAERISSDNLGDRLPVPATGDELQRLSLAMNNLIRRLDEVLQHNTRFMADTSHELRTPLTVMRAELEESLRSHPANAEVCRLAETMLEEVHRLTRIVAGLFAISRLEDKQARPEFAQFDLGTLVASTADQMMVLAEDKSVTISCQIPQPVLVEADRSSLKQVTVNLLDNAIKYTSSGGSITVDVAARDGKAVLEVTDTGAGIPAEALPHVFERFFRVDKTRSRDLVGAGLGLSIVKSICVAHGGTVGVQSKEGEGSRFIIELPIALATTH
jgi:heavy metal sensor kinase